MTSIQRQLMRIFFLVIAFAAFNSTAFATDIQKVAYHLSEPSKIGLALTNIHFHIKGAGGPDKVDIILVSNGPAVKALHIKTLKPETVQQIKGLMQQGVQFEACGNAMRFFKMTTDDLVPGFTALPQGGVTRLGELQMQGYGYIKP